jgi:phage/plasmid-like protein (TIGR03299 family)
MSHELEINQAGEANMVWTDKVPWHGLGTEMDPEAGAIAWMKAANLDWTIHKQPMLTELPNGTKVVVEGKRGDELGVLVRDYGTGEFNTEADVFGPVGPDWVPVQNEEVFSFMEKFCKAGRMKMHTCGALKGGTEIWALCKYREDFEIIPGEEMKGYLLFHSPHVWGKSSSIRNTLTRVVCNNTLTAAMRQHGGMFRMPHVQAFDIEVQEAAEEAVGLANAQTEDFAQIIQLLANKPAADEMVQEYLTKVYQSKLLDQRELENDKTPLVDDFNPSTEAAYDAIKFAPGHALKTTKGTWWGAFNGVTYYEDHLRISHQDDSNVLHSAWFGSGARRKSKALDLAVEYAKAA